jgi:hypothetical protein
VCLLHESLCKSHFSIDSTQLIILGVVEYETLSTTLFVFGTWKVTQANTVNSASKFLGCCCSVLLYGCIPAVWRNLVPPVWTACRNKPEDSRSKLTVLWTSQMLQVWWMFQHCTLYSGQLCHAKAICLTKAMVLFQLLHCSTLQHYKVDRMLYWLWVSKGGTHNNVLLIPLKAKKQTGMVLSFYMILAPLYSLVLYFWFVLEDSNLTFCDHCLL